VASSIGTRAAHGGTGNQPHAVVHAVQVAFAHSTQTVFYIMAGVMAATFVLALVRLPSGRVEAPEEIRGPDEAVAAGAAPGEVPGARAPAPGEVPG
jgi:hypothetical protein